MSKFGYQGLGFGSGNVSDSDFWAGVVEAAEAELESGEFSAAATLDWWSADTGYTNDQADYTNTLWENRTDGGNDLVVPAAGTWAASWGAHEDYNNRDVLSSFKSGIGGSFEMESSAEVEFGDDFTVAWLGNPVEKRTRVIYGEVSGGFGVAWERTGGNEVITVGVGTGDHATSFSFTETDGPCAFIVRRNGTDYYCAKAVAGSGTSSTVTHAGTETGAAWSSTSNRYNRVADCSIGGAVNGATLTFAELLVWNDKDIGNSGDFTTIVNYLVGKYLDSNEALAVPAYASSLGSTMLDDSVLSAPPQWWLDASVNIRPTVGSGATPVKSWGSRVGNHMLRRLYSTNDAEDWPSRPDGETYVSLDNVDHNLESKDFRATTDTAVSDWTIAFGVDIGALTANDYLYNFAWDSLGITKGATVTTAGIINVYWVGASGNLYNYITSDNTLTTGKQVVFIEIKGGDTTGYTKVYVDGSEVAGAAYEAGGYDLYPATTPPVETIELADQATFVDRDLYDMMSFPRILTETERFQVEGYLSERMGTLADQHASNPHSPFQPPLNLTATEV